VSKTGQECSSLRERTVIHLARVLSSGKLREGISSKKFAIKDGEKASEKGINKWYEVS